MNRLIVGDEFLTLDEVKAHLTIHHNLDDTYLTQLIKVARSFIENKVRQVLIISEYTDVVDEKIFPIISISGDTITAGYQPELVPPELKHAMLLLIYNMYVERDISVRKYPNSIDYLTSYYKKFGYSVR